MRLSTFVRDRFVFLAVVAAILTGCASGNSPSQSGQPASRYPWNSSPSQIAAVLPRAPSADLLRGKPLAKWHQVGSAAAGSPGSFVLARNGPGATADFELTGTGVRPTQQLLSPTIGVQGGRAYVVSAWIDASKSKGGTILFIANPAGTETYDEVLVRPGPAARYGFTTHVPDGITKIQIGYYTHGCVLPKGQTLRFALPAVAPASARG